MRIDKWLWCVRLYKTRSLATKACQSGHVTIEGAKVKPSRELEPEQVVRVTKAYEERIRITRVKAFPKARIGAKLVADYMEDLTPEKPKEETVGPRREHGTGRPTKRERREIERLLAPGEE